MVCHHLKIVMFLSYDTVSNFMSKLIDFYVCMVYFLHVTMV